MDRNLCTANEMCAGDAGLLLVSARVNTREPLCHYSISIPDAESRRAAGIGINRATHLKKCPDDDHVS